MVTFENWYRKNKTYLQFFLAGAIIVALIYHKGMVAPLQASVNIPSVSVNIGEISLLSFVFITIFVFGLLTIIRLIHEHLQEKGVLR